MERIIPGRPLRWHLGGLSNGASQTLLYLPPGPWRTANDAMGGITISRPIRSYLNGSTA